MNTTAATAMAASRATAKRSALRPIKSPRRSWSGSSGVLRSLIAASGSRATTLASRHDDRCAAQMGRRCARRTDDERLSRPGPRGPGCLGRTRGDDQLEPGPGNRCRCQQERTRWLRWTIRAGRGGQGRGNRRPVDGGDARRVSPHGRATASRWGLAQRVATARARRAKGAARSRSNTAAAVAAWIRSSVSSASHSLTRAASKGRCAVSSCSAAPARSSGRGTIPDGWSRTPETPGEGRQLGE